MSRTLSSPSAGSTVVDKLKVYEGGTGATNATAAAAALGAIPVSQIGVPGGIAGLTASGKLDPSNIPDDTVGTVNVLGATSAITSSVQLYEITNYDIFTDYVVEAIRGTVTRAGNIITYTAPSSVGSGAGGFKINGRSINVTIEAIRPQTPVLTGISAGSGASNAVAVLTASAFVMNNGSAVSHLNSDWQVATDLAFTNIVSQSAADATNKTSWTSGNLNLTTTYYARVRYRDSNNGVSDWSVFSFTTKATYIPNIEQAKLLASDRAAADRFGGPCTTSGDGNRVAVTAVTKNSFVGAVYIFRRTGTSWTQEAKLVPTGAFPAAPNGDYFGWAVDMDDSGTRLVIGAPNTTVSSTNRVGAVYVFTRNTTTNAWALERTFSPGSPTVDAGFGVSVAISGDGTRLAVAYPQNAVGGSGAAAAAVYVYLRTGTSWAQETTLAHSGASISNFGVSMSMDTTGTRLAVGASIEWNSGVTDYTGFVYIFRRTGTSWTQEYKYNNAGYGVADYFGFCVAIDSTGTRVAVGAHRWDQWNSDTGRVAIFIRTNTNWANEANLSTPSNNGDIYFGMSLAINGDCSILAVGVTGGVSGAAAYLFRRTGTNWAQTDRLQCSDRLTTGASNGFGSNGYEHRSSVAMSLYAETLAIGAPNDNNGNSSSFGSAGAEYIFVC